MHPFHAHCRDALAGIEAQGRYRRFTPLRKQAARFPLYRRADGSEVVVWSSNDYLGMGGHPAVVEAACAAAREMGAGAGGTRNISGTSPAHDALEVELATLHGKPAALLFTSGFVSNQAALSTILNAMPGWHVFSDARNHASMIAGIKGARATCHIFRHNDTAHLDVLLSSVPADAPKLIAFEIGLLDGRRYRPDRHDLRSRRPVWRDDLSRRGARGRHVRPARRRRGGARRRGGEDRHDRGHARQGVRLPWRLHRR